MWLDLGKHESLLVVGCRILPLFAGTYGTTMARPSDDLASKGVTEVADAVELAADHWTAKRLRVC
jgi:hypothetical protein